MKRAIAMTLTIFLLPCSLFGQAQQSTTANSAIVPPLMKFNGTLNDSTGRPLNGLVGVTFALYRDEQGGAPLWLETQNVRADKSGHYTVMLGSTTSAGLPADIFVAGEARWLAVQAEGQAEQPRVLLLSVPYALKAGDAQTLGGLPASAFVLAAPPATGATQPIAGDAASRNSSAAPPPPTTSDVTTSGGTVNALPLFTTATNVQSSIITQTGSGTTAHIGINTTAPATALDVNGGATVRGILVLPTTGTAMATKGFNSQPEDFIASVFNSGTATAVPQKFQWQAEPAGNNTTAASGTLNLLYASGSAAPAETGLKLSSKGIFTFATGQTFPGTGTITGVTAGTDLTGGGTAGKVTLNLNTTALNAVYPQLTANNIFTGTQTVNNKTVMTGNNTAGVLQVTNTVTSGLGPAIVGTTNSSAAAGIKGIVTAVTGTEAGLFGSTSSLDGYGVKGQSSNVGVYGASNGQSLVGEANGFSAGVWGDTGAPAHVAGFGVLGTADDNFAGFFLNTTGTDTGTPAILALNTSSTKGALVFQTQGPGLGQVGCSIDTSGNLTCKGTVSAIASTGSGRQVSLHAVQSPENWFEDLGSGALVNGVATIALDPTFAQTVNTSIDYHVFLTPRGECEGLYVAELTPSGFEVHELHHGTSSVAFDYRIVAKRAAYEKDRLEDVTERYQQMAKRSQLRREQIAARRVAGSAITEVKSTPAASRK